MVIKVAIRAYGSQKVLHVLISNTRILKATGRVFKIRLKFGTFFSRIIGLTN